MFHNLYCIYYYNYKVSVKKVSISKVKAPYVIFNNLIYCLVLHSITMCDIVIQ